MTEATWFRIRLALIWLVFIAGLVLPGEQDEALRAMPAWALWMLGVGSVVMLALLPLGILCVIGIQAINPFSDPRWTRPTHGSNPFHLGNPLTFLHFAAYLFLALGAARTISSLWRGWPALAEGVFMAAASLVLLASVRLCMRLFKSKMATVPGEALSKTSATEQPPEMS